MREELLQLLSEAAEFEHGACCAYLFAALSIKRLPDEGLGWTQLEQNRSWAATLLTIAREEMGHLATVSNLSVALGGAPHYGHPPFPYVAAGCRLELRPLCAGTVEALIGLESSERPGSGGAGDGRGVGELYGRIRQLLGSAGARSPVMAPHASQLAVDVPSTLRIARITDVASAIRAVDSIIADGDTGPQSHQQRLFAMATELRELARDSGPDAGRAVARPVVANPSWPGRADRADLSNGGATIVTDPCTAAVLRLFDSAYHAMLLVLGRAAMPCGESPEQLAFLSALARYPLMTMVLRPLGEITTTLPSGVPGRTAGPGFGTGSLTLPPDRATAWARLRDVFDELVVQCRQVEESGVMGDRGRYVGQTLAALAARVTGAASER